MTKTARLGDLWQVGTEHTVRDPRTGREALVWLQKLNEADHERCIRGANARRAAAMIEANKPGSDEYLAVYADVLAYGDDPRLLIEYLVVRELGERTEFLEAQFVNEKIDDGRGGETDGEWAKDGYLQALRDRWRGTPEEPGLQVAYHDAEHPDHAEAKSVFEEMNRFIDAFDQRLEAEGNRIRADLETLDLDALRDKLTKQFLEAAGMAIWYAEFRRRQLFYGVRLTDNHRQRYFDTLEDVDDLADKVRQELIEAFKAIEIEAVEGKGSPAPASSSSPSGSSDEAETSPPSGPADAGA